MWFKQASLFTFTKPFKFKESELITLLEPLSFTPCLPSLISSIGWVSPLGVNNASLVYSANGFMLLCLQFEEKILPATVIRQAVAEKVAIIEEKEGRVVRSKEKQSIKEELTQTLLPQAFTKKTPLYAYIDTQKQWMVLNSNTPAKIERFISFFKRVITPININALETQKISPIMTHWLKEAPPSTLVVGESAVLQDPQQYRRIIRCQNQNLLASGIQALIKEGCEITQLALQWKDQIRFTLTSEFSLRHIRFDEGILSLAQDDYVETVQQRFDTDFVLMTETLRNLIEDLLFVVGIPETAITAVAV